MDMNLFSYFDPFFLAKNTITFMNLAVKLLC